MQYEELDIPRFGPRAAPAATYRARRLQAGQHRKMVIAGGIAGVVLLVVGGVALLDHHGGPVPVIQADTRPWRVRPEVRGGMQVSGANEDILSGDTTKQTESLAAPSEDPRTAQLRQLQQTQERTDAASRPAPAPAEPPPAAALTPADPSPLVATTPPAPALASAPASPPAAVRPAEPAHVKADAAPPAHGKSSVQLAAVATQDAAHQFWQRLAARMPELLASRKPALSRIERDGRVFWRVRVDGFADNAAAEHFCQEVQGKGGGCSVAAF